MNEGLTLYELQGRIKDALLRSFPEMLWIRAEIQELKENISGHCYIELVDMDGESKQLRARARAVIWASKWRVISSFFRRSTGEALSEGMTVLVLAQVNFSELYGLSLVISDIDPLYTVGNVELARRRTIEKLKAQGCFDMNRSLSLPRLPRFFAVISSEKAAGYGDFMKHLHDNQYGFKFYTKLYPAPMQGAAAPEGIVRALESIYADTEKGERYDAVLILRGGGSISDLACFDDYDLAFNVAQYPLPVMVAVGHERDTHICDMVARVSVKTPTALADYLVEAFVMEDASISSFSTRMALALSEIFRQGELRLQSLESRLFNGASGRFVAEENLLDRLSLRVERGNPATLFERGYSMVLKEGRPLYSVQEVVRGERVRILLKNGYMDAVVEDVNAEQ